MNRPPRQQVERAERQVSRLIGAETEIPMSFAEDEMRVTP
jgi:hypothetical protein